MECETKGPDCKNDAVVRSFWPGQPPIHVCLDCAAAQQRIADAMGFPLYQEPFMPAPASEEGCLVSSD